jgi:hypothetical protein
MHANESIVAIDPPHLAAKAAAKAGANPVNWPHHPAAPQGCDQTRKPA